MLSPKNSASGQTFIIKLICSKQRKKAELCETQPFGKCRMN